MQDRLLLQHFSILDLAQVLKEAIFLEIAGLLSVGENNLSAPFCWRQARMNSITSDGVLKEGWTGMIKAHALCIA